MMKTADNVKIVQANLSRNDFTLHGLHLNISGKENMAELIAENIKKPNVKKRNGKKIKKILLRKKLRKN